MTTTSSSLSGSDADEQLRTINLRTQVNRAWINAIAYPLVLIMIPFGFSRIGVLEATTLAIISLSSSLVVYQLYRYGLDRDFPFNLNLASFCLDAVLVSAVIYLDGGESSMFFLFYLTNVSAATFVRRMPGAIGLMIVNLAAYLTTLSMLEQLDGFGPSTTAALGRMLFLYAAAFLPLRGIAELQVKNRYIRQLRAEENLKVEALSRLTEELEGQSKKLSGANLQIQEANRLKSQFLASMSHELRTPLNSIIGFSSILDEALSGSIDSRHHEFLRNILRSSEHLLALINNLLDLSKIEAGRMEVNPEPFPVIEILSGVCEIMRGQTQRRSIEIQIDSDDDLPLLNADAAKFKQIVFNLLSNAVKFSPDHSRIEIRASSVQRDGSPIGVPAISIEVQDQGIGIAPHDLDVIFEEFRQAEDGFVRQYGGTGLGLTLVRRFLEIQGGSISVESQLGVGTTFTLLIPQNVLPLMRDFEEDRGTSEGSLDLRPRVLIVEDDPIAYANLSTILHPEGYATIRARRGDVVREIVLREKPVAIALDLVLPGLDGWEVLKDLKSDPDTSHIPIIVVTLLQNRELGMALGADDFFLKPVDPALFRTRLHALTLRHRRHEPPLVLMIDDDPDTHILLNETIQKLGYDTLSTDNGEKGLHVARSEKPDLIILDLMMPVLDGFETLAHLRNDPITSDIPVVVLTEHDLSHEERQALEGQISALFSKRADARDQFIETLRDLLERTAFPRSAPHTGGVR